MKVFLLLVVAGCIAFQCSNERNEMTSRSAAITVQVMGRDRILSRTLYQQHTDEGYFYCSCPDTLKLTNDSFSQVGACDTAILLAKENDRWEFKKLPRVRYRDTMRYVAESHRLFEIQGRRYDTYRFKLENPPIDGRSVIFWEPTIGFFLWWWPDWRSVDYLSRYEGVDSVALGQLIETVKRDTSFFYRGIIQE